MRGLTPLEVFGIAIKSEVDAYKFYSSLERRIKKGMKALKERIEFLKNEEEKHRLLLLTFFRKEFPKTKLRLPKKSIAPLPRISPKGELSLSDLLKAAMAAETASEDFYRSAKEKMENENTQRLLTYLANMEKGHHYLLKAEYDLLNTFESYSSYKKFSLEHLGP
jgi:rubrerythrin|uniref:Rubrerythrin n=1 Tax=candidate division WOR-3 bacterium TaxID=2052148 RepID=A0A7C3UPN4_UNCW3